MTLNFLPGYFLLKSVSEPWPDSNGSLRFSIWELVELPIEDSG